MKHILITGATGNVGREVIRYLSKYRNDCKVSAGVRNIAKARQSLNDFNDLDFRTFDFEDELTYEQAFQSIDSLFLLRPPHISKVDRVFRPMMEMAVKQGVKEIVFLSVQGAEKSSIIPHNKIEKLIRESGPDYVFLRPSYFMQNLTTTLHDDIKNKRQIILPAGKAKFNWIDVKNIGEAAAIVLKNFKKYRNKAFDLTGYENKSFGELCDLINQHIPGNIEYRSVNPLHFYLIKRKSGMPAGMILVMIMLHFLPRFQSEPEISGFFEKLSGKKPTCLEVFILREKSRFMPPATL